LNFKFAGAFQRSLYGKSRQECSGRFGVMVSGAFLSACFKSPKKKIDNESVKVTTIALRPDKQKTFKFEEKSIIAGGYFV